MPAAIDECAERPCDDPPGRRPTQQARHDPGHGAAGAPILDCRQHAGQYGRNGARRRGDGHRVGQKSGENAGQVNANQQARNLGRGEHMPGHKPAQRPPQPLLLPGDDGRVWDRQAERMAEQGGDGEPVGDPTHEPGLCTRLQ